MKHQACVNLALAYQLGYILMSSAPPTEPLQRNFEKPPRPRKHIWMGVIISLLVIIIAVEAAIILEQKRVSQRIEAQSEAALGRFLKQGLPASGSKMGTQIRFRNVRFCWSKKICINSRQLSATAQSLSGKEPILFDDIKSFIVNVHNADVLISPQTLQGMFNESVFNYPGSNLRNLTVSIQKGVQGDNHIMLSGSLKYFLWIPFRMDTNLMVDQKTNTLVISVNQLKVFGFIPATWLIELRPFNLDKLLTLPPNRYLTVHSNLMMVKPFGLFPPPRIDGKMASIYVRPTLIQLRFSGTEPTFSNIPQPAATNYIYLQGGSARFGNIQMLDTHVQVIDRNPQNLFQFALLNYLNYLPKSEVTLLDNGGAVLKMPDHENLPDGGIGVEHPQTDRSIQNQESSQNASGSNQTSQKSSFFEKAKARIKSWFGL